MARLIDSLTVQRDRADSILDRAENLGMEVSQPQFELQDVATALTRSRTAIHAFVREPVEEEVEAGLEVTSRAADRGQEALEEHTFRRMGLAASVTIIATLFMSMTVVTGIYGMNFSPEASAYNMPELSWRDGYPFALSLMALLALGFLTFFRRRAWLGDRS